MIDQLADIREHHIGVQRATLGGVVTERVIGGVAEKEKKSTQESDQSEVGKRNKM